MYLYYELNYRMNTEMLTKRSGWKRNLSSAPFTYYIHEPRQGRLFC
jgi:hypothetical protein